MAPSLRGEGEKAGKNLFKNFIFTEFSTISVYQQILADNLEIYGLLAPMKNSKELLYVTEEFLGTPDNTEKTGRFQQITTLG